MYDTSRGDERRNHFATALAAAIEKHRQTALEPLKTLCERLGVDYGWVRRLASRGADRITREREKDLFALMAVLGLMPENLFPSNKTTKRIGWRAAGIKAREFEQRFLVFWQRYCEFGIEAVAQRPPEEVASYGGERGQARLQSLERIPSRSVLDDIDPNDLDALIDAGVDPNSL